MHQSSTHGNPTIHLRAVQDADLSIFFDYQRDDRANTMAGVPARDYAAFMAHWQRILRESDTLICTIMRGSAVAGFILSFIHDGEREVGYWLGQHFWGQGIATTALRVFLRDVEHRPLAAQAVKHNAGSMRVLQKCGFTMMGENDEVCFFRWPGTAEATTNQQERR